MTEDLLALGIEGLGLNLSDANIADLELFLQEMGRWNQVHNLTSIEDEKDSIRLHLIDSIAVLPVLTLKFKYTIFLSRSICTAFFDRSS